LIDDCSTNNSINVIEEYQKYDERIILVKHDTNEGKIKSRTDGIRLAKGTFIKIIDSDDALIHKDILYISLYIAKLGNLDVIEFRISFYINGEFKTIEIIMKLLI
jgi:glycosyltransferase involved in cell wall biosynthesis